MTTMSSSWRLCDKCLAVWYAAPGGGTNVCPAGGGSHTMVGSKAYVLAQYGATPLPPNVQDQWAPCSKCAGLFFTADAASDCCPKDGQPHTANGSGYAIVAVPDSQPWSPSGTWPSGAGDAAFRWCTYCGGLFYAGSNDTAGVCPSSAAPGSRHNRTGQGVSGKYTLSYGPFPEMLNIVIQHPTNHLFYMATSPDGTIANLLLHGGQPIFGTQAPQSQTGGVIGVAAAFNTVGWRYFYACRSNDGSNVVMLASVGSGGDVSLPVSTGLDIIGDPDPSAPALLWSGALALFYRPHYQGQGYGNVYYAPITVDPAGSGTFSVGAATNLGGHESGGGRITATSPANSGATLWCAFIEPGEENRANTFGYQFSSDGNSWTYGRYNPGSANTTPRMIDTPCLFTLPNGTLAAGWSGSLIKEDSNQFYYTTYTYNPSLGSSWSASTPVPGPTPPTEPACMTAANGSCVYLAYLDSNIVQIYKLSADMTTVLESGSIPGIFPTSSPALLCCYGSGVPAGG